VVCHFVQKLPDKSVKLFRKAYSTKARAESGHAIHVCERFKVCLILPSSSVAYRVFISGLQSMFSFFTLPHAAAAFLMFLSVYLQHVMHVSVLPDDSLVIVERPLDAILQSLPEPLLRKQFGI